MNPRWLWFDFIDPRLGLTREQKVEVRSCARRLSFVNRPIFTAGLNVRSPLPGLGFARKAMGCASGSVALVVTLVTYGAITLWLTAGSPFKAMLVLAGYIPLLAAFAYINYRWSQPWYRLALYELGHPICAACGYALVGIDESRRCPECGWRKTHRSDPPRVQWTDCDRQALLAEGYVVCDECGGLLSKTDVTCARCGEPRGD